MSVHAANERTYDTFGRWRTHTYAHSGEAGAVDRTLYLVGSEFVDGSIRLMFTEGDPTGHIESRADGVWNDTGLRFASSSMLLGRDMQVSAVGAFLETVNPSEMVDHLKALIPHIEFDVNGTKGAGHMPILDVRQTFDVFPGPVFGEITGTSIGQVFTVDPTRVLHSATHRTGSIAATEQVNVSYYKGTDNTGTLLNRFMLPPSAMPASQNFTIVYDSDFGFERVEDIFFEFVSENTISLAINLSGDIITSQDGHVLDELDIILDELVLSNDLAITFDNNLNLVVHNRFV